MPVYLYENPATQEVKEIVQTMKEPHVYEEGGVAWKRIFTVPQGNIDTRIDPFNERQFVDKTSGQKETLGDTWDRSKELSEKREHIAGQDPVKDKYFKEYEKSHRGNQHQQAIQEKTYTI